MAGDTPLPLQRGRLAANIMQFCRVLRRAGLPIGPGQSLAALEAVRTVGIEHRGDFYWALHAALITRRDQRPVFDQAFHVFWRNPKLLERALSMLLPVVDTGPPAKDDQITKRLADALLPPDAPRPDRRDGAPETVPELEIDATNTFSDRDKLGDMDFEQMSTEELAAAKRALARFHLPLVPLKTRRSRPDRSAPAIDVRRTLRQAMRQGTDAIPLARKRPRTRLPPLVILCDISGSMSRYSRMMLHFMHAVLADHHRVHAFVFGTRLTNVTRPLRAKDIDEALGRVAETVEDWSGGTRIGACIQAFNRDWSRRVLGQNATCLLITDGLDRDAGDGLPAAMERLSKSCHRLVWLNPLLRWEGYAPKSSGARAMIGCVDALYSVHSLDSIADLAQALARDPALDSRRMAQWRRLARA